ncbi:MAG: hypothetical protein ACJ762_16400 [Solirubrobacteraceae bacterium]
MESQERDTEPEEETTESVEDFVEEVENDPSANPDDDEAKRIQGG